MKGNGLIAATALLAVLGGLVWWTNKHPKAPDTKTPPAPKILSMGEASIEAIRIAKPGEEPVVLKKNGNDWQITEPAAYPADQDAVKSLAGALATLTSERLIDEHPQSLAEFGLVSPPEEIDVTAKGAGEKKIQFGSDAPTGGGTYVKLAGGPTVYTLSSSTKTSLDKSLNDLRDKRLLAFDEDKLTGLSITSKAGTFDLAKDPTAGWQITKPKVLRADPQKVQDLVRKLKDAKMDLTADNSAGQEKAPAAAPVATVHLAGQTLQLTQAADKTYYANGHKLSGDLGDALKDKTAEDFRNRKLFDFGFNDPSKLEIDGVSYDKSPQKQALVDKLRDLSATGFAPALKGKLDMAIVATSGKQEKVIINHEGDEYYAQRENEPAIYVIDPKSVEDLRATMKPQKPAQK